MSYTEDITRPLIDTLSRTAGLPTFQLAGHAPNLAFWMAEVRHALEVIDGYPSRFSELVAAQAEFDVHHPDAAQHRERHEYPYEPPRLAVSPVLAERLSRELRAAANRVIDRSLKEELLDIVKADDLREAMILARPAPMDERSHGADNMATDRLSRIVEQYDAGALTEASACLEIFVTAGEGSADSIFDRLSPELKAAVSRSVTEARPGEARLVESSCESLSPDARAADAHRREELMRRGRSDLRRIIRDREGDR